VFLCDKLDATEHRAQYPGAAHIMYESAPHMLTFLLGQVRWGRWIAHYARTPMLLATNGLTRVSRRPDQAFAARMI
jgi:hypothetical protein